MTELVYPFPDADIVVTDPGQDRAGRDFALVCVRTKDGTGFLVVPQQVYLFDQRDWTKVEVQAAQRNGLDRNQWAQRTEQVRVGLFADLKGHAPSTPEEPTETEEPTMPPFPEGAWQGLFADYRNIVGHTTEAPDVYHFFCFAVGIGATLGRRLGVYHATMLFPNFYVALVGRTGMARKDTARSRANRMMRELNQDDSEDPQFLMLPGVGSAEGLIDALGGEDKTVVVQEAELLSLMAKARRDATSNLLPHLTALYDSPDLYTLKTRIKPVTCKRVFLSLLCGTTPVWLKQSLTEEHAQSGFANRFIFAFGEPKSPMAFPDKVDQSHWDALAASINDVRRWAGEAERELPVDTVTRARFREWYSAYHPKASGEGLLPALAVRFQTFAWKLALLYAAIVGSDSVNEEHLEPALQVVDWLWESNQSAFADFVQHGRGLEEDILGRLGSANDHRLSKRALYRALKVSANELERAAEPMVRLGLIQAVSLGSNPNGHPVEGYQAL